MISRVAWSTGSLLVAGSVGQNAYIAHAAGMRTDANKRLPLQNAALIQMLNGIGLMMTSLRIGNKNKKLALVPISLMMVGSVMFSGFIFYEKLTEKKTFSGYIRYGGSATLFGWVTLALL